MRLFKNLLVATLVSLATCSTSCTRTVPVASPAPTVECNAGPAPTFPKLQSFPCADSDGNEFVCLTPPDAAAIWKFVKDDGRYKERLQVCADSVSATWAPNDIAKLVGQLADRRLTFDLEVRDCGPGLAGGKAWYFPSAARVVFCTETLKEADDGTSRFILAHEIAHAYIHQLRVPYTGSHEAAADELAALLLIKIGRAQDVLDASRYFHAEGKKETVSPWADHPEHMQRFHTLRCLALEAQKKDRLLCRDDLARIKRNWERLLK